MRNNGERIQVAENAPPGWYQAATDPTGTERYWNGTGWSDETRSAVAPPPSVATSHAPGVKTTPQGRELASAGSRIGARIVDAIIVAVLSAPFVNVTFDGGQMGYVSTSDAVTAVVIGAIYEVLLTALRSATFGKMLLGIEIVRKHDSHSPIGFGPAAMRWVPNLANGVSPGLGFLIGLASLILLFTDRFRRSVFDFVGQTYVVRKSR